MKKTKARGLLEDFSTTNKRYIITDFGKKLIVESSPTQIGPSPLGSHLPQYNVWEVVDGIAKEVVDTGDNLTALKRFYHVEDDDVYPIKVD